MEGAANIEIVILIAVILAPLVIALALKASRWMILSGYGLLSLLLRAAWVAGTPLYLFVGLLLLLRGERPRVRLRSLQSWTVVLVLAAAISLVSALWSARVDSALHASLTWISLLVLSLIAINMILTDGYRAIGKFFGLMAPIALAQAATTILFRLSPSIEEAYYRSDISRLFIGSLGQQMYSTELTNNVLNPERAGGFLFVNLNRATMVMGIILIAYLVYGLCARRRWVWLVAVPLVAAIVASGSKSGLALLIVLPLFSLVLSSAARSKNPAGRMGITLLALVSIVIGIQTLLTTADDYVKASEATLVPRLLLWSESLKAITENWLLGLGFGGWYERWEEGGVAISFSMRPAHNWILQAWMDGGIAYLAINLAFLVLVVILQMRAIQAVEGKRLKLAAGLAGSGLLWPIIHGLGDNSPIYSDPQALTFLAMLSGFLLVAEHLNAVTPPPNEVAQNAPRSRLSY